MNERYYIKRLHKIDLANYNWHSLIGELQESMPNLKVRDYFEAKGLSILKSKYIFIGYEKKSKKAIGILAVDALKCVKVTLYIKTILIGKEFQKTYLIKKLFSSVLRENKIEGVRPQVIVFKTYNPTSYKTFYIFSKIKNTILYPNLIDPPKVIKNIKQIEEIANVVAPNCVFDYKKGILRNSSQGVSDKFYPNLQYSGNKLIDDFFKNDLSPCDRLLCVFEIETNSALMQIYKFFD